MMGEKVVVNATDSAPEAANIATWDFSKSGVASVRYFPGHGLKLMFYNNGYLVKMDMLPIRIIAFPCKHSLRIDNQKVDLVAAKHPYDVTYDSSKTEGERLTINQQEWPKDKAHRHPLKRSESSSSLTGASSQTDLFATGRRAAEASRRAVRTPQHKTPSDQSSCSICSLQ